jgi:hypothetical protein
MTKKKQASLADDLMSVYATMGGRSKLEELAKADTKFFKSLLTDIMRLQLREKEIELANRVNEKPNTAFIIKGLYKDGKEVDIEVKNNAPAEVLKFRAALSPLENLEQDEMEEEIDNSPDRV